MPSSRNTSGEGHDDRPTVDLLGELPSRIADLWSIAADLEFVADCCDELLASPPVEGAERSITRRALWEAAVISYGRCFKSGKSAIAPRTGRFCIPQEVIDGLGTTARAVHDLAFKDREHHVAHRVSDLEQIKLVAVLAPPQQPRALLGVHVAGIHLVEPAMTAIGDLRDLARTLHAGAQASMGRLVSRIRDQAVGERLDRMYSHAATVSESEDDAPS